MRMYLLLIYVMCVLKGAVSWADMWVVASAYRLAEVLDEMLADWLTAVSVLLLKTDVHYVLWGLWMMTVD